MAFDLDGIEWPEMGKRVVDPTFTGQDDDVLMYFHMMLPWVCPSKSNRRQKKTNRRTRKSMFTKSPEALKFVDNFVDWCAVNQVPGFKPTDKLQLVVCITNRTYKPDLDIALLMDALQAAKVVPNDRQIRQVVAWINDKKGPPAMRVYIERVGVLPWKPTTKKRVAR